MIESLVLKTATFQSVKGKRGVGQGMAQRISLADSPGDRPEVFMHADSSEVLELESNKSVQAE